MARDPQILLRAVAVIALIAATLATAVQLDHESASDRSADTPPTDDPLRAELERCQTITPEELATDTACQAAWAENRRRFFAEIGSSGEDE
ncbi:MULTISPECIES: putative entry exclusion protein TrbK-alt [unclassified Roseitalea]|uniref:putative entry exclusion protein TrbK-alt n=1 Tax=unclassified Roseitalea TaxID=2639107 RepID=UPI00273D5EF9|nr:MULTISPECIES: putative entry exclusion protein TrbK-alt [unclassified Roseitalea]